VILYAANAQTGSFEGAGIAGGLAAVYPPSHREGAMREPQFENRTLFK